MKKKTRKIRKGKKKKDGGKKIKGESECERVWRRGEGRELSRTTNAAGMR